MAARIMAKGRCRSRAGATLYAVKVLDNSGSGYDSGYRLVRFGLVTANAALVVPAIRVINAGGRPASADDSLMHQAVCE